METASTRTADFFAADFKNGFVVQTALGVATPMSKHNRSAEESPFQGGI
jgi:hypothetical protein